VPRPGPGQVLVKIECAPINPSDTYFMAGKFSLYDSTFYNGESSIKFPIVNGWEGAGVVVENGGGFFGWRLVGKRVSVTKCQEEDGVMSIGGCFQQYMVTTALQCLTIPDNVSFEQGSMQFVNPLTAIGLLEKAKEYKAQAMI
jgi:NADPH:quinone reductase